MEDFSTIIQTSLNTIFSKIFSSLDNSFYYILDNLAFINPSIIENPIIQTLLGTDINSGILAICNSFILGFVIYFSIRYLLSHLIYIKTESPKDFIFKAIIFGTLMNNSLWICSEIISIVDFCSSFIIYSAETVSGKTISFSEFINVLNSSLFWASEANDLFSFAGIVKSFSSIELINLVFSFALRYIMTILLILLSPFSFLCLLSNSTNWIFKSWIKIFISTLLYQLILSLLLTISFSFASLSTTLIASVFYIGTIQAFQKSSYFLKELLGGFNFTANNHLSSFKSL